MLSRLHQMIEEEIRLSSLSPSNTVNCFAGPLEELYANSRTQLRSFAWSLISHSDFFAQYRIAKAECDALTEKCKTYLQNPLSYHEDQIALLRAELRRVATSLEKFSVARSVLALMGNHDNELAQAIHAPAAPAIRR